MLKAVIMDFDGLIIDTEVIWYEIYVEWFKNKKDYDLSVEEFLVCVGSSPKDLFKKLDDQNICQVDRNEFIRDTQELFIERSERLPVKDGVESFIKAVKKHGLKLALATSARREKPLRHFERFNLLEYFDVIVTADEVERIKPFPDLFLKAIEKMGVAKDEAVIIEDSGNGLIAGQNAGIKVIVVPNDITKHYDFSNYYLKVNSLKDLDIKELITNFK